MAKEIAIKEEKITKEKTTMSKTGFFTKIYQIAHNVTGNSLRFAMLLIFLLAVFSIAMFHTNGSVREKLLGDNTQALDKINERLDKLEKKVDIIINDFKGD